ncbi:MAG: hypothetical protein JWN76_2781 [Chitinophagaceae bacterium]|nr:hypothetical protein [Chitinophagaceae bacterium]
MKKLLLATFISAMAIGFSANAQINVNINLGGQPNLWLPSGYQSNDYYYMPDMNAYYYVPERVFVYNENGNWLRSSRLPSRYSNYDLRRIRKVVVRDRPPFMNTNLYQERHDNGKHLGWYKNGKAADRYDNRRDDRNDHDNGKGNGNGKNKNKGKGKGHDRD